MNIDKKENNNNFTLNINYTDLDFIQQALAKQEVRKVISTNKNLYFCPNCESIITSKEYNYCPNCGQKIKF